LRLPALSSIEVAGTPAGTPVTGWEAFKAIELVFYPLVWLAQPSLLILFPIIFLGNVVAFSAPLLCVLFREGSWFMSPALIAGAICGLLLPKAVTGEVFSGYYLWIVSLFLLAAVVTAVPATHDQHDNLAS
jgi:hypothetical protein